MNKIQSDTITSVLAHMSPRTLASFVADLDGVMEYTNFKLAIMAQSLDCLFSIVGADAGAMLAELDVNSCNPLVENAIEEWFDGHKVTA